MIASYQRYARLRDQAGVTDYKVAQETGITRSTFSEWKEDNFRSRPKIEKLCRIAEYFGVSIEELLEEPSGVEGRTAEQAKT